jgi:hypothetical protein
MFGTGTGNKLNDKILRNVDFTPAATYIALFTGFPGDSGNQNEVTGGSYARQQVNTSGWTASSSALADNVNLISFSGMPQLNTEPGIVAVAVMDAVSAGNCWQWSWLSTVRAVFTLTDTTNDLLVWPSHGLVADDLVALDVRGLNVSLPTGLSADTPYWVISTGLTTDAFKVSATKGGSAVNATATGGGRIHKITRKLIANAGDKFEFDPGNFDWQLF